MGKVLKMNENELENIVDGLAYKVNCYNLSLMDKEKICDMLKDKLCSIKFIGVI